jgi:hypothetical protein
LEEILEISWYEGYRIPLLLGKVPAGWERARFSNPLMLEVVKKTGTLGLSRGVSAESLKSVLQNGIDVEPVDFHPELSRLGAYFSLRTEPCEPFPEAVSGGGNGVINLGLLNIIRRMHKRQKLSIREIARLTVVPRNTVTKHLAANPIEPKFATPERPSKIDPFTDKLAGWLKTEGGKSRKQRRTMKQLHADFVALGFTGSYARVAAFARRWRADRQREQQTTGRGTFVPLHFDPGDAFQFDWGEDFAQHLDDQLGSHR